MSNQFSVDSNQFAERNLKTSRHAMFSARPSCPSSPSGPYKSAGGAS